MTTEHLLAALLALQATALLVVVWKTQRQDVVRRIDEHAFLLGVIDRVQADSALEVAQADTLREQAAAELETRMAAEVLANAEIENQADLGYVGNLGMVRAAMVQAGLDPDKDEDVERWNGMFT